ncbi:urod-like protein [Diplodia corticola]|uniref:Urod-like protein n=1 Tax=Diplodia corticola TaxID=236234 RepID=A0A1J9R6V2_9PEZI|nr:urod-like protein [Diplodia corticola]OJD36265.1 urod-like protein [Diplodia corticola]
MAAAQVRGVHLVGSVCLPSAEDVFRKSVELLPGRLRSIPDGETQHRANFTFWQCGVFKAAPQVLREYDATFNTVPMTSVPSDEEIQRVVKSLPELHTGYDLVAIESYELFSKLRKEGAIPKGVKFQVSLPTPPNALVLIAEPYQPAIEPLYEAALVRDLRKIEQAIPPEDLLIQWDAAAEFAMLEGAIWPHFKPWFSPVREHLEQQLARLTNAVSPQVEMGVHLCYGDLGHRHFFEPKDVGLLVDVANTLIKNTQRPISYFHMPVPKERDDTEYVAPLKNLRLGPTELYLGVVHAGDEEGTRRRIATASQVVKEFSVATECGLGRTPPEDFASIMSIAAAVSAPLPSLDPNGSLNGSANGSSRN